MMSLIASTGTPLRRQQTGAQRVVRAHYALISATCARFRPARDVRAYASSGQVVFGLLAVGDQRVMAGQHRAGCTGRRGGGGEGEVETGVGLEVGGDLEVEAAQRAVPLPVASAPSQ